MMRMCRCEKSRPSRAAFFQTVPSPFRVPRPGACRALASHHLPSWKESRTPPAPEEASPHSQVSCRKLGPGWVRGLRAERMLEEERTTPLPSGGPRVESVGRAWAWRELGPWTAEN